MLHLKREDTRFRDWNRFSAIFAGFLRELEKRRYSITRLKQVRSNDYWVALWYLKREDTRLRDWNDYVDPLRHRGDAPLKREDTRLRDWNNIVAFLLLCRAFLEKRRYSITRLKRTVSCYRKGVAYPLKREDTRFRDWNIVAFLRSISVLHSLKREDTRFRDWNRPQIVSASHFAVGATWKEKILDSEIETLSVLLIFRTTYLEKRRYSIPRLKRCRIVGGF